MEALLHKSQIMEDHVDINAGMGLLEGRQSGRKLGVGSSVRARIVSFPHKRPTSSKIGLTCKQTGLGSHDGFMRTKIDRSGMNGKEPFCMQ